MTPSLSLLALPSPAVLSTATLAATSLVLLVQLLRLISLAVPPFLAEQVTTTSLSAPLTAVLSMATKATTYLSL
jgi:hypothetical protein